MSIDPSSDIRVMLVDDSAVIRSLLSRILEPEKIKIVGSYANGSQAVAAVASIKPDIVILDVEMPVMDGITALPQILSACPGTRVVMCSTLTVRNAEITLKALGLGATECLGKPTSVTEIQGNVSFKDDLLRIVKNLGRARIPGAPASPAADAFVAPGISRPASRPSSMASTYTLNTNPMAFKGIPAIIAIGSSTGGPNALFEVIPHLANFRVPIVLTQHMPATFTAILAQHITKQTGVEAVEGAEGMPLVPGRIHVAPGGYHMLIKKNDAGQAVITLDNGLPEHYCKPSVNPMIRSLLPIYSNRTLAVILTGMGSDGVESCQALVEAGGRVIAQDEATSVVWGMPGAVATNNLCSAVLPLKEIGPWIKQAVMKG